MSGRLRDRTALVTGGGRGIGQAIARLYAGEGADVAVLARTREEIEATADEVKGLGRRALAVQADVALEAQVGEAVRTVLGTWGRIDILVNNAGIVRVAPVVEMAAAEWDEVQAVNLRGAFLCTRAVLPEMVSRRDGVIINVSSISGRRGTARLGAYCASKFGLIGLTEAVAEEVRAAGVRVNAICPGSVDTAMLKISFPGARPTLSPDDVARVALYLASDESQPITGAVIDVFGD